MMLVPVRGLGIAFFCACVATACASDAGPKPPVPPTRGTGMAGASGTGGGQAGASGAGGSPSGTGGAAPGTGGAAPVGGQGGAAGMGGPVPDGGPRPPGTVPISLAGQIPILPSGVPPIIPPDCPGDPTAGWTEYADTFRVEHPFDLPVTDRFSIENNIYNFWVMSTDQPLAMGNTTAPRTEARWSNFTNTQPHMWEADMMFETPSDHVTIMQVHTTTDGAGPVYLRVDQGAIHPLNLPNFVTGLNDKWFNLKVAFDPTTLQTTIWINNCQKLQGVIGPRGNSIFYFKNGTYTCPGTICKDHYKNMHLYQQ
jgi:hypothetical protein